jgi:hypothetical protein
MQMIDTSICPSASVPASSEMDNSAANDRNAFPQTYGGERSAFGAQGGAELRTADRLT